MWRQIGLLFSLIITTLYYTSITLRYALMERNDIIRTNTEKLKEKSNTRLSRMESLTGANMLVILQSNLVSGTKTVLSITDSFLSSNALAQA